MYILPPPYLWRLTEVFLKANKLFHHKNANLLIGETESLILVIGSTETSRRILYTHNYVR